jgi:hypothetical protein
MMIHYKSFKLRQKILGGLKDPFFEYFYIDKTLTKVIIRKNG